MWRVRRHELRVAQRHHPRDLPKPDTQPRGQARLPRPRRRRQPHAAAILLHTIHNPRSHPHATVVGHIPFALIHHPTIADAPRRLLQVRPRHPRHLGLPLVLRMRHKVTDQLPQLVLSLGMAGLTRDSGLHPPD